jgi:hypothetical protein
MVDSLYEMYYRTNIDGIQIDLKTIGPTGMMANNRYPCRFPLLFIRAYRPFVKKLAAYRDPPSFTSIDTIYTNIHHYKLYQIDLSDKSL